MNNANITSRQRDEANDMPLSKNVKSVSWVLRPIVLFAAAYTIVGILHEWAHALTAYSLGVPSMLLHLYVNLEPGIGTLNERAIIRAAGPVFCLGLGLVCWVGYGRAKGSRGQLPLLYLAWFGIATFFGNLMGTPFVGDFSGLAIAFDLPMAARYGLGLVGLLSLCALSFYIGTQLRKWSPPDVSSIGAMTAIIVVPAFLGTATVILIFLPMPSEWAAARVGESAFWLFAAIGAFVRRKRHAESNQNPGIAWPDLAVLLASVVVVRLMAGGISLVP